MASETIEHFLLHCGKYETERQEMLDCLNDIGYGPKKKGSLCVSESLLLAPSAKHGVSKKDNAIIKHALFEFLEKIERSIYCLLYTSPSPRDGLLSRMPSSA